MPKQANKRFLHWLRTSCIYVGRPACFYSSLHKIYAFLQRRIVNYSRRTYKKPAETAKNVAGTQKNLQELSKVKQEVKSNCSTGLGKILLATYPIGICPFPRINL